MTYATSRSARIQQEDACAPVWHKREEPCRRYGTLLLFPTNTMHSVSILGLPHSGNHADLLEQP